ncbi:hypothetical protein RCL_jg20440.t1 [Rhizophagus clarus]|uniref:RNase H type-1 domain-containing protein n=1 Tax=Rhizophagus clarus TaxID=94130 RepID=A0A8H3QGK3_9GLOM|nr:hypothetical protein RCL_jg20440.t1 [Rhizophagus clarus]
MQFHQLPDFFRLEKLDINFIKVKAHTGDPENELADELAKKNADSQVYHHITFNYRFKKHRFVSHFKNTSIKQKLHNFSI